eukprot:2304966-Amphidinium_carterae.2
MGFSKTWLRGGAACPTEQGRALDFYEREWKQIWDVHETSVLVELTGHPLPTLTRDMLFSAARGYPLGKAPSQDGLRMRSLLCCPDVTSSGWRTSSAIGRT